MSINLLNNTDIYDFKIAILIKLINIKLFDRLNSKNFDFSVKNKFSIQKALSEIINNYNYSN